jgi:hypothetical protein
MVHPLLYEINTRCWLRELSDRCGRHVTLGSIPESEFVQWQKLGFTHIWLMGVWMSGPRSRAEALNNADLRRSFAEALPDWKEEDVGGSPYAIADYQVSPALGGDPGLLQFRERLHQRGMKLVLDFVPNHLGLDHPWLRSRPELFVQAAENVPGTFLQETSKGNRWLAHGKDPFFAPWTDTVQLDYRLPMTRQAMAELLLSVADRCDGVRCDMAMLLLNDVFARTWDRFPVPGAQPERPFWSEAIGGVKAKYPGFVFLAEVYWALEPVLQSQGFDFTYDKVLYDLLVSRNIGGVHYHLMGMLPQHIAASAHFLENHDEHRVGAILGVEEQRVATLLILSLPGLRLLHEGQLEGARRKIPVQLIRRFPEEPRPEIEAMYESLLETLVRTSVGKGTASLPRLRPGWADNPTAQNIVAVQWQEKPDEFELVVTNLAPHRSQCHVPLSVPELANHEWSMIDLLGEERYVRSGKTMQEQGLYLDVGPHGAQIFQFKPIPPPTALAAVPALGSVGRGTVAP